MNSLCKSAFTFFCILLVVSVQAEYEYNTIDAVFPLGNGDNRFVLNCGARSEVVFNGKHKETGEDAEITVYCGEPTYHYQLNVVGYVPIETTSVEVLNCAVQKVPDMYITSVKHPEALPNVTVDADGNVITDDEEGLAPKRRRRRGLFDFLGGLFGGGSSGPSQATVDAFNKIHQRDASIKAETDLLANTGQRIQGFVKDTNALLTELNDQTNKAFDTMQSFVKDSMSQMLNRAADMMAESTVQLNAIVADMGTRVNNLLNTTNQQLAAFSSDQIVDQTQATYMRMLAIVNDTMSSEWEYLGLLVDSVADLKDRDTSNMNAIQEFRETLKQLQYHQYGFGTIARSYHAALKEMSDSGYVPFLRNNGTPPKADDDYFMLVSRTSDFSALYCGQDLYLICRQSDCFWYTREGGMGIGASCAIPSSADHPFSIATIDDAVFAMIAEQDDPQLILKKSAVMLEINSVYGPDQRDWGVTLGEGFATWRQYSLFDGDYMMSKCDRGRFGAFKNQWVPVYRLSFAYSSVKGAWASYKLGKSSEVVTINITTNNQWVDPWRGSLPQNDDIIIFNRTVNLENGGFYVYSVPSNMIQVDGPVMTRLGKIGYFMAPSIPTNISQFYLDWTELHGPVDPRGFTASLTNYQGQAASSTSFCSDFGAILGGLCAYAKNYVVDWKPENLSLSLSPNVADVQVVLDLPFGNPKFQVGSKCPAAPHADDDPGIPKNFVLNCNEVYCQLKLWNPFPSTTIHYTVAVAHKTFPNCSYSFPVNLHPNTAFRMNQMLLTLQVCVGNFTVRVSSGHQTCFENDASRAELPPIQELASYVLKQVTNETQNIIGTYTNLLNSLQKIEEKKNHAKSNFSRFLNSTTPLDLKKMGFNITQWQVYLDQIKTNPLNRSMFDDYFNLSLDLHSVTLNQTDYSALLKNQSDEVANMQKKVDDRLKELNQKKIFGFIPEKFAKLLLLVVGICVVLIIAMVGFRIYRAVHKPPAPAYPPLPPGVSGPAYAYPPPPPPAPAKSSGGGCSDALFMVCCPELAIPAMMLKK